MLSIFSQNIEYHVDNGYGEIYYEHVNQLVNALLENYRNEIVNSLISGDIYVKHKWNNKKIGKERVNNIIDIFSTSLSNLEHQPEFVQHIVNYSEVGSKRKRDPKFEDIYPIGCMFDNYYGQHDEKNELPSQMKVADNNGNILLFGLNYNADSINGMKLLDYVISKIFVNVNINSPDMSMVRGIRKYSSVIWFYSITRTE